ncbi:unnamed protein product [Paramecium octaurelia]|uniref:Uncharacterized protein n=1 Tax=Paramecium octaurelia TaxID=43137 RepID=A0A8S1TY94_PAROT|nr:unnamed protein product [Paramecium octaurelia]
MKQRSSQQSKRSPPLFKEIKNRSLQTYEACFEMAFNMDDSLFLISTYDDVQIFQFKNGFFKFVQNEYKQKGCWIRYSTFFNQRQQIMPPEIKFVRIYPINLMSSPKYLQTLQLHSLPNILHNSQKQIIVGGNVIQIWKIKNNSWYCSQIINQPEQSQVYGISINDEGNTIVACCKSQKIVVLECNSTSNWLVAQIIQVNRIGYQISFINNEVFTYQSVSERKIILYAKNKQNLFTKRRAFKMEFGGSIYCPKFCCFKFPPIFNKNKELLINKFNQKLQIIRFHKEQTNRVKWELKIEQQFKLGSFFFVGAITHNGDHLITYERREGIYQVWQHRDARRKKGRYQQNQNKQIN